MEVDGEEINGKFCFFGVLIYIVILYSFKDLVYIILVIYLERSGLKFFLEQLVKMMFSIVLYLFVCWLIIYEFFFYLLFVKCY